MQLWNAAQLEMVHMGKMHGFMRCAHLASSEELQKKDSTILFFATW